MYNVSWVWLGIIRIYEKKISPESFEELWKMEKVWFNDEAHFYRHGTWVEGWGGISSGTKRMLSYWTSVFIPNDTGISWTVEKNHYIRAWNQLFYVLFFFLCFFFFVFAYDLEVSWTKYQVELVLGNCEVTAGYAVSNGHLWQTEENSEGCFAIGCLK